jgi:hypothetical protein
VVKNNFTDEAKKVMGSNKVNKKAEVKLSVSIVDPSFMPIIGLKEQNIPCH